VSLLKDYATADVTSAVSRGIFSQHRLLYALLTAVQIGLHHGDWITREEVDALVSMPHR
jgi:hypothetical protein